MDVELINSSPIHEFAFAFDMKLRVPDIRYFRGMSAEDIDAVRVDRSWSVRSSHFAIRRVDGVRVSLVDFWDGSRFRFPHVVFNGKMLLDGDQGIELPANSVTIFKNKNAICHNEFNQIRNSFVSRGEDFVGYIMLDFVLSKKVAYFDGVSFGLSPDLFFCLSKMYGTGIEHLDSPDESMVAHHNFVSSLRLFSYPYEPIRNIDLMSDIGEHNMELALCDDCYIVLGAGRRVFEAWHNLYSSIPEDLNEYGICYRTDGDRIAKDSFFRLKKDGYIKHDK